MRLLFLLPLFASAAFASGSAPSAGAAVGDPGPPEGGMYAREAVSIWDAAAANGRMHRWKSPDGRSTVSARWVEAKADGEEEPLLVSLTGAVGMYHLRLVPGVGTEFLWRPDSRAVAFYASEAGLNGHYDLFVVGRYGGRLQKRDLSRLVMRRFGSPVRCDWPEPPNVGVIRWLPNGNLIAVAEIVHHSVCDSYGTFKAYEVDPDAMRIVRSYNQIQAKRRFGKFLGWGIAEAPDRCILRPRTCRVADGYAGE